MQGMVALLCGVLPRVGVMVARLGNIIGQVIEGATTQPSHAQAP